MAKRVTKGFSKGKKQALGILLLLVAIFILVSLVSHSYLDDKRLTGEVDSHLNPFEVQYRNQGGMLGAYLSFLFTLLLGWLAYFLPLGFIFVSLRLFASERAAHLRVHLFLIFMIALLGTLIYNIHMITNRTLIADTGALGGFVGEKLTLISVKLMGELGSYILLSGALLILLILFTSLTPFLAGRLALPGSEPLKKPYNLVRRALKSFFSLRWLHLLQRRQQTEEETSDARRHEMPGRKVASIQDADQANVATSSESVAAQGPFHREEKRRVKVLKSAEPLQIKSMAYTYPGLELLKDNPHPSTSVDAEELAFTARMLRETLDTFGVRIDGAIERFPGPVITRYEFKPGTGIKINQIVNLSDDLALALKAKRIRIIAPIPGKAAVGVEIPNRRPQLVYLKDILTAEAFSNRDLRLPLALGKTTAGKPYVVDLTKLPHLLIAGATGSGKSVCINILITSLLYRLHPHQVRFILIDPKMLELTVYRGIPHLGRPVVTSPKRAERVLTEAVVEMEGRYHKLANVSVRNIEDYNKKQDDPEKQLPYIVIFVDELADLLMSSTSTKTELLITRLAQMARAVGIHLVLATQRPSVDVITGLIKANFPSRLAFQVSSKVDSRTIIDANGAEKLLGRGDMLFLHPGQPEPTRIHGTYVSSEETDAVVKFIKEQGLEMLALESISQATGNASEPEVDFGDPLFREACEVVIRHKQGSVSLLQRRLGIGYQRAARLIDKLEQAGIVSPFDGSKAREVMVDRAYLDALFSKSGFPPASEIKKN